MDIEKIKQANTKYIGKQIKYFEELESTHLYAKEIAEVKSNNGLIILVDMQTGGIGTKGRKWYTGNANNIAMTIVLNSNMKLNDLDGLTIKIAQWVQSTIKELYDYDLQIKKPNDLYLNQKKIGGILTQTSIIGEKINYLLISVGINVNETQLSEEVKNIATS